MSDYKGHPVHCPTSHPTPQTQTYTHTHTHIHTHTHTHTHTQLSKNVSPLKEYRVESGFHGGDDRGTRL